MAFAQSVDFQRPASQASAIDRKPTFFSDEFDTNEEPFMESTMISPATHAEDRRDSFGNQTGLVFSPQSTVYDFPESHVMHERQFPSTNPFSGHSSNPFLRQDATQFNAQHNSQWPSFEPDHTSQGSIIPGTYESFNPDFEPQATQGFHNGPFGPVQNNVRPTAIYQPAPTPVPMSASPPPGKDWMTMAEQGQSESTIPKRLRGSSDARYPPGFRSGDGIRKKNARFEIPQERNLANIDRLIEDAHGDEEQVKELKQQKRLLRNRQAALDSRQRKKQRAEELEIENKQMLEQMSQLNDQLKMFRMQAESASQEKDHLQRENAQLQELVQQAEWDKENMVNDHTKETSDLRKKIQVLTEIVDTHESSDSSRNGSANYDFPLNQEMSGLSVDGLDMGWDDPFADFVMDGDMTPNVSKPLESTLVIAPKKKVEEEKADQSGTSGLLMLLLMCGAWVASKATTSMPVTIPRMPEEVRSDAAVVFDDLMKDHGVSTFQATGALEQVQSTSNVRHISFAMPGASSSTSRLSNVHNHLTKPTKRQEVESAFSLSVKQYEGLTSTDFAEPPYSTPPEDDASASPSHRRHLIDSLKAMRDDAKGHATANVYTRSLLWERIPDDVVQQFKRMADQTSSRTASVNGDD